tara:strand:- start:274 stop:1557 length:1284 start_codon:yes stop_codon:yes gene_type:complete
MEDQIQLAVGGLRISKPSFQNVKRNILDPVSNIAIQGGITLNKIRNVIPKPPEQLVRGLDWAYKSHQVGIADQAALKLGDKASQFLTDKGAHPAFGAGAALAIGFATPGMEGKVKGITNLNKFRKLAIKPKTARNINPFNQRSYATPGGTPNLTIGNSFDDAVQPLKIEGGTSSRIDPDEMVRRRTLEPPGFKLNRKELRQELVRLQDEGMDLTEAKKHLLGDEDMWIDNLTGEPISIQKNTKDPSKPRFIGWWSRIKRGGKRTLLTEQQSLGPGETAFTKYNAKTNKVELAVKKGDEIHHWNSIIDKSSAYTGLNAKEAKELTGLVREAGWMFGDNKANLIKMIRSDHKKIHKFMRENGIEDLTSRETMEKLYKGKSVKERFKILRGFMDTVQGAVDEELIRMGYQMPKGHAAAQSANRKLLKIGK